MYTYFLFAYVSFGDNCRLPYNIIKVSSHTMNLFHHFDEKKLLDLLSHISQNKLMDFSAVQCIANNSLDIEVVIL